MRTPSFMLRRAVAMAVMAGMAATGAIGAIADPAQADTAPAAGTPTTVAADALSTWQVNGVVWSAATVGNTVYATGQFTRARPPGTNAGDSHEVARANLLAFDISTGKLLAFNHRLNGPGYRVIASPDGSRIYVGGAFTRVDGRPRAHVAAFVTATGALDAAFHPSVAGTVRAIAVTSSTVYLGGNFRKVGKAKRIRLAAVRRRNGALLRWAPVADAEVYALTMSPNRKRVIVGGKFQHLNKKAKVGVGAVDASTGRSRRWISQPIPTATNGKYSFVTDLRTYGSVVYGSADGEGKHWFDGRFAANANTGALIWLDNCYGATYGIFVTGGVVYSVGHAHDCSSLGAFGETTPITNQRALAETTAATGHDPAAPGAGSHYRHQPIPSLLHWFPTLSPGTFTGKTQAAWAITGNSRYVALLGEFTKVNGVAQQGLTRFAIRPLSTNKQGPLASSVLTPTVTVPSSGSVKVTWRATWDRDNATLNYRVVRDDGTVVALVPRRSAFWSRPQMSVTDTGLTAGTTYRYRIQVNDALGNVLGSSWVSITA